MAPHIDYDALRKKTLGTGDDEAVTVNTRALIDKVLARYSGEWTTLRELLQNAADASSKRVKISLETLPSATVPVPQAANDSTRLRHVLLHHTMKAYTVENDGQVFNAKDWARLKKIAEGNPDETKIGAFGVGFYSVFADSEEPFVSSGQEALAFYWKGDALFTKSLRLSEAQANKTTFMLPNRNKDSAVPNLLSLCRFLASSLTFVGLEKIELWLDDWKIMTLNKTSAPSADVQIPKEVSRKTREGLMHVDKVVREAAQLSAQWLKAVEWNPKSSTAGDSGGASSSNKGTQSSQSLRAFFHRLAPGVSNNAAAERQAKEEREAQQMISEDLMGTSTATIFVHVNRATIKTLVPPTFSVELERATKKPPPKQTSISLLSASFDESEATQTTGASKVFESFVPSGGKGRIFIGFTTNQTTGLNVHISTPSVIPTVERESIDLVNRYIKTWNIELLRVAGIVSRVAWTREMDGLQQKLQTKARAGGRNKINREDTSSVLSEATFLHQAYSWSETTPSPEVGKLMEEAFWTCNSKSPINTLSTRGVLPASQVRLEPEDLSFVEDIPALPSSLASVGLVKKLVDYGIITEVTISDIKTELEGKALNLEQLKQFLEWILQKVRIQEINEGIARSLLDVTVANDNEDGSARLIVLGEMKSFLNPSRIPAELPVPSNVLPFKVTKSISKPLLELMFEDLQMVPWLRWLIENGGGRGELTKEQDLTRDPDFARSVYPVISKQWEGLSQSSKATVVDLLSSRTTMPTRLGMRKPPEAYFSSVKLFDDLPVVEGLHAVKDKVLLALGVRKTIEIRVIIDRLMVTSEGESSKVAPSSTKWNHVDLIKYLTSVRGEIPTADIKFLRNTKLCPAETESLQPTKERYLISELYVPDQAIRRLGLPTLQWPGVFRPESSEGKFLNHLGLRTHPTYEDLISIMAKAGANGDVSLRDHALKYFIDHHTTKGYASYDHASVPVPYLPIQGSEKRLASPSQVFVNERAAVLGFDILRRDLQVHSLKFGVKQDPPIVTCIDRLIKKPPQTKRDAREMFGYMAGRVSELTNQYTENLGNASLVPVLTTMDGGLPEKGSKVGERIKHVQPRMCFLGHGDSKYADIFDYVDFGQEANSFLLRVGSKHEPSISELAKRLVVEPARLFSILGDSRYLELLRNVAESWSVLKKDKPLLKDMRASRCLLAYKEISAKTPDQVEDDDGESAVKSWTLAKASEIIVIDDLITYREFRTSLLAAPMEEALETLYHNLGAPEVSTLLEERQALGGLERDQDPAAKLQALLHERVRLFLHDYGRDEIKHDQNWIQKRLSVQCVQSITMTLSLRGYSVRRRLPKQAVISNESPILYMTSRFDMLEVSRAVAPLLLYRVKPQSVFMLEMMLESSLNRLGRRGYNVQRILNEKAREAKIAEEKRKQQEDEEKKQIQEREIEWQQAQAAQAARIANQPQIPGDFPDSPEQPNTRSSSTHEDSLTKPKSLLSGFGKRFNFDQMSRSLSQTAASVRSSTNLPKQIESSTDSDPPPPYTQSTPNQPTQTPTSQPESVTAPHRVQENLVNLIQASRPHNSNALASNPQYNDVKETSTYCDAKPAHDLTYIGSTSTSPGMRLFLDKSLLPSTPPETFLAAHAPALHLFASILLDCADAYALRRESVHIFYDASGSTIAFNSGKALFFNFRYFESLHLNGLGDAQSQQQQQQSGGGKQKQRRQEAVVYWSVVMAHELAHNVVADHSSQHSYYTESLVMQYFAKIAGKAELGGQAVGG